MISVVITSYNYAQFLADSIQSALQADEVIVVDDGSTDKSLEVARRFPVKVISQVNKGLSSARNTGIMNAKGDYILFLDADDILLDGAVEKIRRVAAETNADVISPSFRCFGMYNNEIILMSNPKVEHFKTGNRVGYCSAVKKDVLLEVGGYSPRMWVGYEDYHLWFDLLSRGKNIVTIPEVLWLYRTKEKSMITESIKHHEELMAQIAKDFPQLGPWTVIKTPLPQ